jgi:hypothetical protein
MEHLMDKIHIELAVEPYVYSAWTSEMFNNFKRIESQYICATFCGTREQLHLQSWKLG